MPLTNDQLASALKRHSPERGFPYPFGGYEGLVMDDGQAKPPLIELEQAWQDILSQKATDTATVTDIVQTKLPQAEAILTKIENNTATAAEQRAVLAWLLRFVIFIIKRKIVRLD
jgi:hypothetical protein